MLSPGKSCEFPSLARLHGYAFAERGELWDGRSLAKVGDRRGREEAELGRGESWVTDRKSVV